MRYAIFVLILISLQVTDYKIDNYNISNQRREKNIDFQTFDETVN